MGDLHRAGPIPSSAEQNGVGWLLCLSIMVEQRSLLLTGGFVKIRRSKRSIEIFCMRGCIMLWAVFLINVASEKSRMIDSVMYKTLCHFCFYITNHLMCLWITEIKNNNNIMIKYHPKFWADGSYQCCRQTEKLAPGCEKYNLFESSKYLFYFVIICVQDIHTIGIAWKWLGFDFDVG